MSNFLGIITNLLEIEGFQRTSDIQNQTFSASIISKKQQAYAEMGLCFEADSAQLQQKMHQIVFG